MIKPTDDEIVAAASGRKATYVVRNVLADKYRDLKTPWVLRQLKRLEKSGRVIRVTSSYAVQLTWATPDQRSKVKP